MIRNDLSRHPMLRQTQPRSASGRLPVGPTRVIREGSVLTGDVTVNNPGELANLQGVTQINGTLAITNGQITDLNALRSLSQVSGHLVLLNTNLSSLDGLQALGWVGGELDIESNRTLANLDALQSLVTVGGLSILDNPSLTSLPQRAVRVGEPTKNQKGGLTISGNRRLPAASAQAFAKACTVAGMTQIDSNGA